MKKFLLFVFGGVLGAIAGAGGMLVVYPFIFPPPEVNETVGAAEAELIGEAMFRKTSGQDAGHWAVGGVKFYRRDDGAILAELQGDFEAGPGPNFWLYFNRTRDVDDEDDFLADTERVRLHKLKSFRGSQVYVLDARAFANSASLTIWCDSFNQYIASANLPSSAA